ncbi:MAG: purine-nucleoside phosphorylase [Clostridia bacterium]|nr:purine-nucleoside phosphorylase [Clostridia bacterium]
MSNYPTPHINAKPDDLAKTVLMPGDPKRSRFVAENFLEKAVLVNDVRGVQGYTGLYKGRPVSVMASGMGMPSIGIYSYELFNFFGVENIVRIGSAGGLQDNVNVRDVVLGQAACTDSNFMSQFGTDGTFAPIADYGLLKIAAEKCDEAGVNFHVGNILSSDLFYSDRSGHHDSWRKMGVLAVEMEAAALYANAARAGKKALAVCTVSDHIYKGDSLDANARERSLTDMIKIALETAISL